MLACIDISGLAGATGERVRRSGALLAVAEDDLWGESKSVQKKRSVLLCARVNTAFVRICSSEKPGAETQI